MIKDRDDLLQLPEGWLYATLEEISENIVDCPHSTPKFVQYGKYCIDTTCIITGKIILEKARYVSLETYHQRTQRLIPKPGDILFSREGTIGIAVVIPDNMELCLGQRMMMFRPSACIIPTYYMWAMTSSVFKSQWKPKVIGTTSPHVNIRDLKIMVLPIAPLNEQKRIVGKIEALQTRSQRVKEAVDAIPQLLDQFRQSVLAAAFRGDLTADWRENNPDVEPASVLLERTAKQLNKNYYEKTQNIDITGRQIISKTWNWTPLDLFINKIQAGKNFSCPEIPVTEDTVGLVKISAVTWGKFDEKETKTVVDKSKIDPSLFIQKGDFLVSRANTIELVGASVIVEEIQHKIMISDKVWRVTFLEVESKYINYYLKSKRGRKEIESRATGNQMSMRNISQKAFRDITIALPPVAEQQEIVHQIQSFFKTIDIIKQQYQETKANLDLLNQSILAKAFRGELVPQNPNDEPASILLERIRAEREKLQQQTKAAKKSKGTTTKPRSKKAPQQPSEAIQLELPGMEE